ncbi:Glycosyltransferase involved in cell wall bisynthesis [Sphingomonas sp. OV641]|uniref:glycosyltransferase n=1 Tax=Sphingomonas sp. OV641 TaxID=1881068 RepID=UPI0008C61B67|nr:glycosyltransferase [Sphingomonas sp. OV641]SEJ21323.1 Glycosyltransferase involved in cell wall bisynthesis [Sphingomonas sp. OV641]
MPTARPRILCIHQGGELYGSDRSFLQSVQALRQGWPDATIDVLLATDGPLHDPLSAVSDTVRVRDLCVLRLANPIATGLKSSVALPYYLGRAAADLARADLAYVNTTVIADYMLAGRVAPHKTVIHAREIPKTKAMPVVRSLVRASGARVIFNSQATRDALALPLTQPQVVIHNGVDAIADARLPDLPSAFTPDRPLRIALLGRINDWKGQDLLVDAIARLPRDAQVRLRARIVGSTFQNVSAPVEALEQAIAAGGLADVVALEPFRDEPGEVYRWADICVVPSRLPEPFGRVAIEAMSYARPVIAAAHGGLVEIVEHGRSGWLVAPNDADSLAAALAEAIDDSGAVAQRSHGALERFAGHFSAATMSSRLQDVLGGWIPRLCTSAAA